MTEQINGTEVYYELAGSGESKVLLLHGWGCDTTLMKPVADLLADRHRTLVIDFPGHGKSGRPPEPWGVPEFAACLEELLRRLDFTPCSVIAHSFGGRVAALLASEKPEMFRRLILTGAAGIRPKATPESRERAEKYRKMKRYGEALRKIPGLHHAADQWQERLRQKYGSRDYNALDEEMRKTFVKVINQDLTDRYPLIRNSTLLIWGEADTETPLWMGRKMEELIPDAGLVILENGTHFAYLEQLQRFATIAGVFLKEDA